MQPEIIAIIGLLIGIGASILGFLFKINRCLGRHEGEIDGLKETIDRIAKSFLSHLDKKK